MDPLSIAASVVGLLGATAKVSTGMLLQCITQPIYPWRAQESQNSFAHSILDLLRCEMEQIVLTRTPIGSFE